MPGKYKYLFGPVPSRRFGRSLGVDLTPFKTCSLNCVFCQLGRTAAHTIERREFVPTVDVLVELADWIAQGIRADYITLSGSGEPTLHSRFGDILDFVRSRSTIPTALLTNGTLLHLPEVRTSACKAGVVKVSLSAWDQASFERINLPHAAVTFDLLVAGERALREEFDGPIWMEVMLVEGFNSTPDQVRRIAEIAKTIRPDRIHLNTVVRPSAEVAATAVPRERLEDLTDLFVPRAEVIAEFAGDKAEGARLSEDMILDMIRRRPCTAAQIAGVFDAHLNEVLKYLGALTRDGRAHTENRGAETYFVAG
ncbi:MAG: radical SAM protein [Kiritimatiellae bacterium]|nr:radical SAM protein [Kiritimatiellia bacterium]